MGTTAATGDYKLSMGSLEMSADNIVVGNLVVIDPRFPGVTFTGTAQSVNEQMMALESEASPSVERYLHKRSTVTL
jgi:hypothetical protein